jgi:hypothetical protein
MIKINFSDISQENRVPLRPVDLRQDNFDQLFDYTTFIYDIFSNDNKTYIISPPATDEDWTRFKEVALFDNKNISNYSSKLYKSKIQKLIIKNSIKEIKIKDKTYNIPKIKGLGENKVCLYTLQKDNDPQWIIDWANWHIKNHGVTDVIIYDNNSAKYSIDWLKEKTRSIKSIVHIESINFSWGPINYKDSEWDSDFLQYAMFEHVRYYYLNNNGILINSDIDELIVGEKNLSISDAIKENSCLIYPGKWVYENIKKNSNYLQHDTHSRVDHNSFCNCKWCIHLKNTSDDVFLRVHNVEGKIKKILRKEFIFLHHILINTNWQYERKTINGNFEDYDLNQLFLSSYGENIYHKIPLWVVE